MTVYREKESFHDLLKRGLLKAFTIYTLLKYIRVSFGSVKKEMFRQFHTGYRIQVILQTCLPPT